MTELEKRIIAAQKAGQTWAAAEEKFFLLDETRKSYLSSLENDLDNGALSEAKLERLARGSKQWQDHIAALSLARGEQLRAKVRYEASVAYYEAARTAESTRRTMVSRGLYQTGQGE